MTKMIYISIEILVRQVYTFVKIPISLRSVHFTICRKKKANWKLCVSGALSTGGFHCRDLSWSSRSSRDVLKGFKLSVSVGLLGRHRPDGFWGVKRERIIHYVGCHLILLFSMWDSSPSAGLSAPKSTVPSSTSQIIKPLIFCMC